MPFDHSATTLAQNIADKLVEYLSDVRVRQQYAWWILEAITQQTRASLIVQQSCVLTLAQQTVLDEWLNKLIHQQIPLQYLLGSVAFLSLEILVESPTLIPRPETEEWIDELIIQLQQLDNNQLTILDLGTGSGCIALALAQAFPQSIVYAIDKAPGALELARKNARHNSIKNVLFIESDLYTELSKNIIFDLIVSNPPYIEQAEWENLDATVKEWEDKGALVAQQQGLAIIQKIIDHAAQYLKSNEDMAILCIPQLIIEIGHQQGALVTHLFKSAGFSAITVHKDLAKKDRVVSGRIHNVESVCKST
jgi:release factor glutamine methyltransferase